MSRYINNLKDQTYEPYRKPNNNPVYINKHSNHPPKKKNTFIILINVFLVIYIYIYIV